ncbi:TfoX/Sxy family protein [soil metagenome]
MASRKTIVDFIVEQIADAGAISAKKMFGEYGIYCDGKIVVSVCDDQLFVKPTPAGKAFVGEFVEVFPYPGAKPYLLISGDQWDDREWLAISAVQLLSPRKRKNLKGSTLRVGIVAKK